MDPAHGQVKCRARVFPRGFWGKCPSKHGHYTNAFRYSESLGLPSMPFRVSLLTYLLPQHCRRICTESFIHGDFPGERPLAASLLPLPTVVSPRRLFRSFPSLNGWPDRKAIPALKLLPFFQKMAKTDVKNRERAQPDNEAAGHLQLAHQKTMKASETLQNLESLSLKDAERWVGYWKGRGLFAEVARL
jgi:hypothetical protein